MTKVMSRRILLVVAFLALLLAGDRLLGMVLGRVVERSQIRYSRLYRGGMDNDVVLAGNSRGANAFDAALLGKLSDSKCINLSYNGLATVLIEALVNDYVEHNAAPKTVVLEISNLDVEPRDCIQMMRCYYPDSAALRDCAKQYDYQGYVVSTYVSRLYAYNNELFLRSLYYLNKSDQSWSGEGSPVLAELLKRTKEAPRMSYPKIRQENLDALVRLVSKLKAKGIEVRLVVSPYLPEFFEKFDGFDDWLAQVRQALGGDVKIWNYTQALQDHSNFVDRLHLSKQGSQALMEKMVADGLIEPAQSMASGQKP
jgi:hypothetical protein